MFIISNEHFSFALLAAVPLALHLFYLQNPTSVTAPLLLLRAVPRRALDRAQVSVCTLKVGRAHPWNPKEFW